MTNVIIGISFILIWLATSFFFFFFVIKTKNDLLARFSESQGETKGGEENRSEDDEHIQYKPFDYINRADPVLLLNYIQNEHPQVIALVLAHLEPNKASAILKNLSEEIQGDVTKRIACMDRSSPEIIREIERVLEKELSTLSSESYCAVGGVFQAAEILNLVDQSSENQIIKALEGDDPELAEAIIEAIKAVTSEKP
jgi:flagellar motor switch protein FliG